MRQTHYIYVCTTCDKNPDRADSTKAEDGLKMLAAVKGAVANSPYNAQTKVRGVKCMGGCSNACSVGFIANGKQACLFNGLSADAPEDVIEILKAHIESPIGRVKTPALPARLKPNYLCRIPQASDGGEV